MVKKVAKNDHFAGWWHKMAQKRHFWKEGVNESLRRWGLGVTLPATKIGLALVFLGSEICVVKKVPKKAIFRTLRCRQLGRRGLNRKTKSTSRFFGPNYPPVQNFSEKNDKKFLGTISVFFVPIYCRLHVEFNFDWHKLQLAKFDTCFLLFEK